MFIIEQAETTDFETETSDNLSVQSSLSSAQSSENSDNYVLQRENAFAGKFSLALKTKKISIKTIFNTNVQGEAIVQSYKISKCLTRKSRNVIAEIIITEFMNKSCR